MVLKVVGKDGEREKSPLSSSQGDEQIPWLRTSIFQEDEEPVECVTV